MHDLPKKIPTHILQKMHLFLLWIINRKELHGYEMIKLFKKEGMKSASASRLYPLLNSLHEQGLILQKEKKQGARVRKVYALTKKGKKQLYEGKKLFSGLMKEFLKEMIQ